MPLSARNQFPGTVASVRPGSVMSEVTIDIGGGHQIVSLMTEPGRTEATVPGN